MKNMEKRMQDGITKGMVAFFSKKNCHAVVFRDNHSNAPNMLQKV